MDAISHDPPSFEVVDVGDASQRLIRHEVKYLLPGMDVGKLRQLLEVSCRGQLHHDAVSQVGSIYFDDAKRSSSMANLDGVARRSKLRLRWYDTLQPRRDFFLEVKWRNNRTTGKDRLKLRSDVELGDLNYRQIVDGCWAVAPRNGGHISPGIGTPFCWPITSVNTLHRGTVLYASRSTTISAATTKWDANGLAPIFTATPTESLFWREKFPSVASRNCGNCCTRSRRGRVVVRNTSCVLSGLGYLRGG